MPYLYLPGVLFISNLATFHFKNLSSMYGRDLLISEKRLIIYNTKSARYLSLRITDTGVEKNL